MSTDLVDYLVAEGKALRRSSEPPGLELPWLAPPARRLVNGLDRTPQAFLFGCFAQRQMRSERPWQVPWLIKERAGTISVRRLSALSQRDWVRVMRKPTAAHRLPDTMAEVFYRAVADLNSIYGGDAALIWSGEPSSATVVRRLLGFHGVGPKIASMTANILVRRFHVPLSDYRYIDLSVDVHVRRVMRRLGLVSTDASNDVIAWTARELNPDFPGVFDPVLFRIGRSMCHPQTPACDECPLATWCDHALGQAPGRSSRRRASGSR